MGCQWKVGVVNGGWVLLMEGGVVSEEWGVSGG